MTPLGIDPGAELLPGPYTLDLERELVEAVLERQPDGKLEFVVQDSDGHEVFTLVLRADFLDDFIAQARSEAAA